MQWAEPSSRAAKGEPLMVVSCGDVAVPNTTQFPLTLAARTLSVSIMRILYHNLVSQSHQHRCSNSSSLEDRQIKPSEKTRRHSRSNFTVSVPLAASPPRFNQLSRIPFLDAAHRLADGDRNANRISSSKPETSDAGTVRRGGGRESRLIRRWTSKNLVIGWMILSHCPSCVRPSGCSVE